MEYIPASTGTVGRILCCSCGIPIEPNPTNTCVTCLRQETNITVGIPRQLDDQFLSVFKFEKTLL